MLMLFKTQSILMSGRMALALKKGLGGKHGKMCPVMFLPKLSGITRTGVSSFLFLYY